LEIGAITTELLNVASETTKKSSLQVRAIDLHSMHDGIEEVDFLQMPILSRNLADRYDVLCCSMVLNSVTDPTDRGTMLARLFHHLRPGGLCFLTLPKTCLNLSPYMTPAIFESMLAAAGLDLIETKESPKIAFFVTQRPMAEQKISTFDWKWTKERIVNRGQKFRTRFSIILNEDEVKGRNLVYST